jgi:FRG domain
MATSWNDFFEGVSTALEKFHERWGPDAIPFFRGQCDSEWPLLPGVFRGCRSEYAERCIFYEFRSSASMLLGSNLGPWNIAFLMQHHGLPTRLLDWTESFAAALYFATRGPVQTGAVWMLDAYSLNKETAGEEEILDLDADFSNDYFEYFIADKPVEFPGAAVAVLPNRSNLRLSSQRGLFTLHASAGSLEGRFSHCLQKFELAGDSRRAADHYLELAGVNEYSLFPDLDGLSRHLKERYGRLSASSLIR